MKHKRLIASAGALFGIACFILFAPIKKVPIPDGTWEFEKFQSKYDHLHHMTELYAEKWMFKDEIVSHKQFVMTRHDSNMYESLMGFTRFGTQSYQTIIVGYIPEKELPTAFPLIKKNVVTPDNYHIIERHLANQLELDS